MAEDSKKAAANYMYKMGMAPETRAVVSQRSRVFGYTYGAKGFTQLGVISEFSFDESRAVDPVRGIGYGDIIAELVPGLTEPMKLTLNKTLLYTANIWQIVGYKGGVDGLVRSLRHHRWPFDIKHELVFSEIVNSSDGKDYVGVASIQQGPQKEDTPISGSAKALLTYFEGCWFDSHQVSFAADSAVVMESSSCTVTDVVDGTSQYGDYVDTGLAPVAGSAPGQGYSMRFAENLKQSFVSAGSPPAT